MPRERGEVMGASRPARGRGHRGAGRGWHPPIEAITFDFGNTLVPVDRSALAAVVASVADQAAARWGISRSSFLVAWAEERERQFREDVPRYREVDLAVRFRRVLARLRGMPPPASRETWDDQAAARVSTTEEIAEALDLYSGAFVRVIPPDPAISSTLERLAPDFRLAILSNWPLAAAIDAYVVAAGWASLLTAVVVSERVGTIKPHPAVFRAAETALAGPGERPPAGRAILHVGDDWAADVVGASRAGWRTAFLRSRPVDSPLPTSEPDGAVEPDLVLDRLTDLEAALRVVAPPG
jgi:FMN phosphatase YigB (HAD superfamily)